MSDTTTPQAAETPAQTMTQDVEPQVQPPAVEPWIRPQGPEDADFCNWLQAISEGKNPNKHTDKATMREFARVMVLRKTFEEVTAMQRMAAAQVEKAMQNRQQMDARRQSVQGSIAERLESLREIFMESAPETKPTPIKRKSSTTKTQKNRQKAARRAS